MKQIGILLAYVFLFAASVFAKNNLNLETLVTGGYDPAEPLEMVSMLDGKYYACIDASGTRIIRYDYRTGNEVDVLLDLKKAKGDLPKRIVGFTFSPNEGRILVWPYESKIYRRSFITEYFLFDRNRNSMEVLSANGPQRDAKFSPDSRSVAFARNNNLFIRRLDYGTELEVTTNGERNVLINGVTDWVYEEEFETTCAYDWSPDSKILAYIRFDESEIPSFTIPLFGSNTNPLKPLKYYSSSYSLKYPSAGERNSKVSVWAYTLQSRSAKKMEISMDEQDYIPRIRFTRNSNQLAVMVLNRAQNIFKMYFLNPKSAQATLILTEQNDLYVEPSFDDIVFSTKYFTYTSSKNGYKHLYLYRANGGLEKQLTTGNWNLIEYLGSDTVKNIFYYQSNEKNVNERAVYSVDLKGKKQNLTPKSGSNAATFNSDYSLFINTWSNLNEPPVFTLVDKSGKVVRTLESNQSYREKMADLDLGTKEFITVPVANGESLNGWILKPAGFDSSKKYPVVLVQYSGPGSQSVKDEYEMDWEYLLSQQGMLVVCVDGRGTGGKSEAFQKTVYTKLGVQEAADQIAVAKWLKTQTWVDGARIGIWGWSYGGFVTLMSMTDASGIFKAGVAVAPVVDWRYYNTVYTERYMKTPSENGSGYDLSSPLLNASKLKGRLLLVWGMADDNVRANQNMDFAEELIKGGIQFDMQVYPTSNHSILGDTYRKHLYHRMVDFFKFNL